MIAGLQSGLYRFDPERGGFTPLATVEADRPDNRLNDAVTDPQGRIWFGSMDDTERQATGDYYRFEKRRSPPCRPAVGRHHQRPGDLAGRPDPLSCRHARRPHPRLRRRRGRHARPVAANSSGSRRTKAIPTGRRSTAKAACGSACSWAGRRAAIRRRASCSRPSASRSQHHQARLRRRRSAHRLRHHRAAPSEARRPRPPARRPAISSPFAPTWQGVPVTPVAL